MKVYLAASSIAGVGVFAGRDYAVGEWIMSFKSGEPAVVSYEKTTLDPANYVQIGIDQYIYPQPPSLYLNHSCQPNAGIRAVTEIIALNEIKTGTEITFDYSTCIANDPWEMDCVCGTRNCRRRIGEFRHLPLEIQLFYAEREAVSIFCIKAANLSAERSSEGVENYAQ